MTRRLSALMIPLALAGCATASRQSAEEEGLRARMYHSEYGVRVALSEPAHVAIFEVVPGERVSLYYPAVESDVSFIAAGRSTLHPGGARSRTYLASYYGRQAPLLYMIASREPLDEAFIHDLQQGLRSAISEPFRSNDPRETMEFLASLVVPMHLPETAWAEDVLSRVPGAPAGTMARGAGFGMCRSGSADGDYSCLTPAQQAGQRRSPPPPLPGGGNKAPGGGN